MPAQHAGAGNRPMGPRVKPEGDDLRCTDPPHNKPYAGAALQNGAQSDAARRQLPIFAAWMVRQMRSGVAGMSMWRTP
jgi:hypothetical protein